MSLETNFSGKISLLSCKVSNTRNFQQQNIASFLGAQNKECRTFKKIADIMLEMKFQALKCFLNFLSMMIFRRVSVVLK